MLTKWKLFNFKAIQQETELEFKPLTIFAGANSSGKSTVLQSILLVAQTLSNAVTNRPIVLNGDLVRLGQFDDIKSLESEASQITIGWELQPKETRAALKNYDSAARSMGYFYETEEVVHEVRSEVSFDALSGNTSSDVLQLQPSLITMDMQAVVKTFEQGFEETRTTSMLVRQLSFLDKHEVEGDSDPATIDSIAVHSSASRFTVEFDSETESRRQQHAMPHEIDGVTVRHFLPTSIQATFAEQQVFAEAVIRALTGDFRPAPNLNRLRQITNAPLPEPVIQVITDHFSNDGPLAEKLSEARATSAELRVRDLANFFRRRPGKERIPLEPIEDLETLRLDIISVMSKEGPTTAIESRLPLPDELRAACQLTARWFSSQVKYLGPLRDDPKALYPLVANIDPRDVGLRGEHTAAVFHVHRDLIIDYIPSENFANPRIIHTKARRSLKFAVFEWLKYLGVATAVDTRDLGKLGHEMQVSLHDGDAPHDLTHVGVGVSQLLPIVISCLLAEPDTLLIFEQPELHLHPKVQTLLADFFIAMAVLGKQCVLETHSEYLISRLRFRSAAAEGKQLVETMQIYFVEKTGNQAEFRKVDINEYGAILDWPKGFFDQSQHEAQQTLKAAFAKKEEERNK
jgi:predicted ATPase